MKKGDALRHLRFGLVIVAALGVAASLVLLKIDEVQFYRSYLLAFVYLTGLAAGCLGILMLQFTTGGEWGLVLRRVLTAGASTLPLMALLCIPVLLGIRELYAWHDRTLMSLDPILSKKAGYLSPTFFVVRSTAYFVVFVVVSWLMLKWQTRHCETGDEKYLRRLRYLSAPGMFVVGVVLSLGLIDWVMSLEPRWYSTIYALIWITGSMLAAMAFSACFTMIAAGDALDDKQKKDIGNLLLAFIMLWAYCSFSQFLLVWSGNLREEIPWYLARINGVWGGIALALVLLHFGLPFLLLLSRSFKQARRWLVAICIFLLAMRFVDAVWMIDPAFSTGSLGTLIIADVFWMIVMGSIWGAGFLWVYTWQTGGLEYRA